MITNPCQFTDSKGRVWDTSLDLLKAYRVDKSDFLEIYPTKFSLARFDKALLAELLVNSPLLFAVIWVLVQEQAREKYATYKAAIQPSQTSTPAVDFPRDSFPVNPEEPDAQLEFISAITGSVIDDARQAFLEALSDFFRDQQTALLAASRTLKSARVKLVEKTKQIEPMLDQLMDQELDKAVTQLKQMLSETPGTESTQSPQSPDGNQEIYSDLAPVLET